MKKIYQVIVCLLFCGTVNAQDHLWEDIPDVEPVVKPPLAYFDLLRNITPGWTTQKNTGGVWNDLYIDIHKKNSDGRFTQLSHYWNRPTGWDTITDYEIAYTKAGGTITGIAKRTRTGGAETYFETKAAFSYSGGRLQKTAASERIAPSTSYTPSYDEFYVYDVGGRRILDSAAHLISSEVFNTRYDYDNNGRCIKRSLIYATGGQNDTMEYTLYEYNTGGQLVKSTLFNDLMSNDTFIEYNKDEYTYNVNGEVETITEHRFVFAFSQMQPQNFYWQTFDTQGTLLTMGSKSFSQGWRNKDSIIFSHLPGGEFDTSYVYSGVGATGWETTASQRYIFRKASTGIKETEKNIGLRCYPNPATDRLAVEINMEKSGHLQLQLTDMTGKRLQAIDTFASAGINTIDMPLHTLAPGIYFLTAGNTTVKIIKQ